jgi:PilZ domain
MEPHGPDRDNPTAGRRTHSRLRVRLPARLTTLDGTTSAILVDLSFGGARLITSALLVPGQEAVLAWHGFEAFGMIGWVHDRMCGMHFDEFLAAKVLIATRDLDDINHLPGDRELIRDSMRGVARDWVSGVRRW